MSPIPAQLSVGEHSPLAQCAVGGVCVCVCGGAGGGSLAWGGAENVLRTWPELCLLSELGAARSVVGEGGWAEVRELGRREGCVPPTPRFLS